tara:strand:- start:2764 stop:3015 length:252 start_codon:yes stop_codon:yes gene_type:complete
MKTIKELKSKLSSDYEDYSMRIFRKIREKAIKEVKVKIAMANKSIDDFERNELEVLVKEEEQKIKARYKDNSILLLLAYLGLN